MLVMPKLKVRRNSLSATVVKKASGLPGSGTVWALAGTTARTNGSSRAKSRRWVCFRVPSVLILIMIL